MLSFLWVLWILPEYSMITCPLWELQTNKAWKGFGFLTLVWLLTFGPLVWLFTIGVVIYPWRCGYFISISISRAPVKAKNLNNLQQKSCSYKISTTWVWQCSMFNAHSFTCSQNMSWHCKIHALHMCMCIHPQPSWSLSVSLLFTFFFIYVSIYNISHFFCLCKVLCFMWNDPNNLPGWHLTNQM